MTLLGTLALLLTMEMATLAGRVICLLGEEALEITSLAAGNRLNPTDTTEDEKRETMLFAWLV